MTTHYGNDALATLTNNVPDFEELKEECSYSYDHADCPSGTDTRQRLSVKRVDGAYLWHCYNCGDSGYYRDRETISRIRAETEDAKLTREIPKLFKDLTKNVNYDTFRIDGQLWLGQYEFGRGLCSKYQIAETEKGIVLPIYNDRVVTGYQVRQYDRKPKYLSYITKRYSFLNNTSILFDEVPLVIVEDLLSSYKLNYVGYPTLCLLGTKLDAGAIDVLKYYREKRVLVWLDDDVAGHTATMELVTELNAICPNVQSMFNYQPKEIGIEALKEMEL